MRSALRFAAMAGLALVVVCTPAAQEPDPEEELAAVKEALHQALDLIDEIESEDRVQEASHLENIATLHANIGSIDEALATVERIGVNDGDDWLERTERGGSADRALSRIAGAQARAGDAAGASETAARIADESIRSGAWRSIASAQASGGDSDGARQSISMLEDKFDKTSALERLPSDEVDHLVTVGDFSAALELLEEIEDDSDIAMALANVGRGQALAGDQQAAAETFRRALNTTDRIADGNSCAGCNSRYARIWIAQSQLWSGDSEGAQRTLDETIAATEEDWLSFAINQHEMGDTKGAIRTAQHVLEGIPPEVGSYGLSLVAKIANVQARIGDHAGAAASLQRCEEIVVRLDDDALSDPMNRWTLMPFPAARAINGNVEGALEFVDSTDFEGHPEDIAVFLWLMAKEQAEAGYWRGALEWISTRESPIERLWALLGVAEGIVNRGYAMAAGRVLSQ